ncbi:hypothetical protein VW23_011845 [Devosia insulae DS-56]|uniref:Uncharacterized protein n=1 Tax=Devosia insulae DS-56 TaxID=1116389 RepID=A0A1E5XV11_9HYPH|nr:hypothetical protein [Devosia insulae]OEO32404.1 hypothetical protein VW23_011845 [Devosia insulae DS-56]
MYFYHEGYHDTYYADASLDALRSRERHDSDQSYEPIRIPAIVTWLASVSVVLCGIVTAIHHLS